MLGTMPVISAEFGRLCQRSSMEPTSFLTQNRIGLEDSCP